MKSTIDRIRQIVSEFLAVPLDELQSDVSLYDLQADSLDLVELIMDIEKEFGVGIPDEEASGLLSVGAMAAWVDTHIASVEGEPKFVWGVNTERVGHECFDGNRVVGFVQYSSYCDPPWHGWVGDERTPSTRTDNKQQTQDEVEAKLLQNKETRIREETAISDDYDSVSTEARSALEKPVMKFNVTPDTVVCVCRHHSGVPHVHYIGTLAEVMTEDTWKSDNGKRQPWAAACGISGSFEDATAGLAEKRLWAGSRQTGYWIRFADSREQAKHAEKLRVTLQRQQKAATGDDHDSVLAEIRGALKMMDYYIPDLARAYADREVKRMGVPANVGEAQAHEEIAFVSGMIAARRAAGLHRWWDLLNND